MKLTARSVKSAPPGRHNDGRCLYLHVDEKLNRRWVLRTQYHGRTTEFGLGPIDLVPLARAREIATAMRLAIREGRDPLDARPGSRRRGKAAEAPMTFAQAAEHVWNTQVLPKARNEKAAQQWITTIQTYANPMIGKVPVADVDSGDIIGVLEPIWISKEETARRVRQRMSTVFRWAIVAGKRTDADPTTNVEAGLAKQKGKAAVRHHRAVQWQDTPAVYSQIAAAKGTGAMALSFAILCASRSGEVRGATWDEVDLEARIWLIPKERMKMNRDHRVPLSQPAIDILRAQMGLDDTLVFPASRRGRTISDMTLSAVLKRLGIEATPHGFRTSFRTWCAEATNTPREVAELALAHVTGSAVERAYARTDHFERRIPLMAKWAEFLTTGANNEKVIDLATAR